MFGADRVHTLGADRARMLGADALAQTASSCQR